MERWPSLALRLLARIIQKGAEFLSRQGQRLDRLAVQSAGSAADVPSSGEHPDADRPSGEPPPHWLEKVEGSEGPVKWIDHTEEPNTLRRPPPLQPAYPGASPPPKYTDPEPSYPGKGHMQSSRSDKGARSENTPKRPAAPPDADHAADFSAPRFATEPSRGAHDDPSRGQEHETENPHYKGESPSPSWSEESRSDKTGDVQSSRSIRLRQSPSPSQFMQEEKPRQEHEIIPDERESPSFESTTDAAEQGNAPLDHYPSDSGLYTSAREKSNRLRTPVISDQPSPSEGNVRERHTQFPSLSSDTNRPTQPKYLPYGEAPRLQASRSPHVSEGGTDTTSGQSDGSDTSASYPADPDVSTMMQKGDSTQAPEFPHPWPDLPNTEQLLEDEASQMRRLERHVRSWERRQRLNREQRGELWSE